MSTDLSKKLFDLRKKHGLTLEQVANVVGVGKSTVRKWETGMIANMRRDKVALLAKALHTTPAYLMGWTEEENTPPSRSEEISADERDVLELYRSLSEETRPLFVNLMRSFGKVPEQDQPLVLALIDVALNKK